MDNKKLIDADKIKKWIDTEFDKRFPGDYYGYADGRQSVLDKLEAEIDNGTFDADPIPPTIKRGDTVRLKGRSDYSNGKVVCVDALVKFPELTKPIGVSPDDLEVSHG